MYHRSGFQHAGHQCFGGLCFRSHSLGFFLGNHLALAILEDYLGFFLTDVPFECSNSFVNDIDLHFSLEYRRSTCRTIMIRATRMILEEHSSI